MDSLVQLPFGRGVYTAELESFEDALRQNKVPIEWSVIAYPSLRPLGGWLSDLNDRVKHIRCWLHLGETLAGFLLKPLSLKSNGHHNT